MWSWWEHRSFAQWDVIVVGAGLVGLTTALAVRARRPKASILVLERGWLPTGASTRNAGFACFGSLTELLGDVEREGLVHAVALVGRRHAGLRRLRALLGDEALGYEPCGGWELLPERHARAVHQLDDLNAALMPLFGSEALRLDDHRLPGFGFGDTAHLVALPHEGSIDTGRMMRSLLARAGAADIAVFSGARVDAVDPDATGVNVVVGDATLRAGQVALCTNAFTRTLLPDVDVTPGRGQVLVTEPVPDLPFRGVFHRDEGYVYFRHLDDGRVLLGGARHLDVAGETTTGIGLHDGIQAHLDQLLHEVVLPGRAVKVAHRWAGVMAFGGDRAPLVQRIHDRLAIGVRLGGMGVALGAMVGDELAQLLD